MPYDILVEKINALPQKYYEELVDYLEFLTQKSEELNSLKNDDLDLKKMREASLKSVWENLKNDSW